MLVKDPDHIRIAMLGMVEGNGHPFSWSAIINGGYDPVAMEDCGFPAIPQYLGAQPPDALGIAGARVTHIWCDNPADAARVSRASRVPHLLSTPDEALGQVDAVVIATDIGSEHLERARPFITAGVPVFIDKPLTDREDHLRQFADWHDEGKAFLSSSCMRYAAEFHTLRANLGEVGEPRLVTVTMAKSWERYGIHALEAVYPLCAPGGYRSVTHSGTESANVMRLTHESGVETLLCVFTDLYGAFGHINVYGTRASRQAVFADTFFAFKAQLQAFVGWLRTGELPVPFSETLEQMKIIIAGLKSRAEGGRTVLLEEIKG